MLGNDNSGKKTILKMYSDTKYEESHMATLGLDYITKNYTPKNSVETFQVKIFDTTGLERFRTFSPSIYKTVQGIVVVFDVANEESFSNVKKWLEAIAEHADSSKCFVLVGNTDDPDHRKISIAEARELAKSYNLEYFECTAKLNLGITEFFEALFTQIFNKRISGDASQTKSAILNPKVNASNPPEEKKCNLF